jgi:hypothetical protein
MPSRIACDRTRRCRLRSSGAIRCGPAVVLRMNCAPSSRKYPRSHRRRNRSAVGAETEHRARHLRHDGAEAFLALADVLEQALDRDPHLLHLLRQASQLVAAGQVEAGFEVAVRQAVGKPHQLAQRLDQARIEEQHDQQQRHGQLRRQHEHIRHCFSRSSCWLLASSISTMMRPMRSPRTRISRSAR